MEAAQALDRPLTPEAGHLPTMEETDTRISSEPVADAKVDTVEAPDTDAVQQTTSHLPDAAVSDNTECELAPPSLDSEMRDSTAEAEMGAMEGSNETRGVPVARLEEHDSLVTVRLSEPPIVTLSSASGGTWDSNGTLPGESEPSTTANRSARSTMPTVNEDDAAASEETSEEDEPVNWDQLQQNEDNEASGQNSDNTAMLLARLEQENAKLATNPKSARVQIPQAAPQSPRRVRPPSVAQLRDMAHGPTPSALRYSMLPPPPMTDLEFYAALVRDYHETAARLPTLLSNKIRKGIPPPLRGVVWQGMTGATRDVSLGDQYEQYCGATSPYEGIIGKDLGRSFPGVDMFREPGGDGQRMLGRVLKSFSLHEPRIGYCQGLAFLVGPLLMHMPDREAFCVLVKLMENYDLRSSYMPDLAGLHVRIFQFRELLRSALPELSSHLDDLQVDPAAYVSQWFLSFFAVTCPLPMLFRMYDVLFAEGAAETIMRVALSLMQKNQTRLLACAELEDAIQLLLSRSLWGCYNYNADEFVLHFLGFSNVVTRDRLASLDQAYRQAQIANINQPDNSNVDRTSAISTVASRFLGRLWAASSPSTSSPPTPIAAPNPSSSIANSSSSGNSGSSSSAFLVSPRSASPPANAAAGLSSGLSARPLRPLSMLQRSSSKNSVTSTVNSMEATSSSTGPSSSSSSVLSSTSTDATSISRDSSSELNAPSKAAALSGGANKSSDNDRYLHSQIEDLLTALSDLQRQHTLLTDQLQREREERNDDRKAVQSLMEDLRKKTTKKAASQATSKPSVKFGVQLRTTETNVIPSSKNATSASGSTATFELSLTQDELQELLEPIEARFASNVDNRRSSIPQTKSQLRDELGRAKEQLANELAKGQDRNRQVIEMEQEMATMKDQLRDTHAHARVLHQDKQRLERSIHDLRTRVASEAASAAIAAAAGAAQITQGNGAEPAVNSGISSAAPGTVAANLGAAGNSAMVIADAATEWFGRATGVVVGAGGSPGKGGGLRELKLGRSKSTPTQTTASTPSAQFPATNGILPANGFNKRSSSLFARVPPRRESVFGGVPGYPSSSENNMEEQQDALVLELVQAKTSEAVALQEAEEAKQKLESLRKALGLSPNDMASMLHNASNSGGAVAAASTAASAAMGMLGRLTTSISEGNVSVPAAKTPGAPAPQTAPATSSGYGFFGWRR